MAPERLTQAPGLQGHLRLPPALAARHQGQPQALEAIIGAGIGPGGGPQQGHPQPLRRGIDPLGPIQQHRQPPAPGRTHRGQPGQGRHLPAGPLPLGAEHGGALQHAGRRVGGPTHGGAGQGNLQTQQLMALAPVEAEHQLQPGLAGQQAPLQPHRAGAAAPPQPEAAAERTCLDPLRRLLPQPGQGAPAIGGGKVPGIPELATVAAAAPGQGSRQLGGAMAIQQLLHPAGAHHRGHQTIAQSPAPRTQVGGRLQDDRVLQRQGIAAARVG